MLRIGSLLLAIFLTGCSEISNWQDSLFVGPPPTEAQIKEAMAYVGASDLPLPRVTVATAHEMAGVSQGFGYTVVAATVVVPAPPGGRYGNTPAFSYGGQPLAHYSGNGASIILAPSWNLTGGGEAILVHEAYNYARAKRGLPGDDCGAYTVEHRFEREQGSYGQENASDGVAARAGCPGYYGF